MKVTEDVFYKVKKLCETKKHTGFSQREIAAMFNISPTSVSRVANAEDYTEYFEMNNKPKVEPTVEPKVESEKKEGEYRFEIEVQGGVVIARLYYGSEYIAQGHGHIFHEDDEGIGQAGSYALKRLWHSIRGVD